MAQTPTSVVLGWTLVAAVVILVIVTLIAWGVTSTDTKDFTRDPSTGCLLVNYHENHAFGGKDYNYSGLYCKS
jgi:hypothetical protein